MGAVEFNTSSAGGARASLTALRRRLEKPAVVPPSAQESVLTLEERKAVLRRGGGRNQTTFLGRDVLVVVCTELLRQDDGGSIITRRGAEMAEQSVMLVETLEKAGQLVDGAITKFNAQADTAITEAKKRVSQLNDYNNRLSVSLVNLGKTLGDERMLRALENADRLASALTLLDSLERNGSLGKVIAALTPPGGQKAA